MGATQPTPRTSALSPTAASPDRPTGGAGHRAVDGRRRAPSPGRRAPRCAEAGDGRRRPRHESARGAARSPPSGTEMGGRGRPPAPVATTPAMRSSSWAWVCSGANDSQSRIAGTSNRSGAAPAAAGDRRSLAPTEPGRLAGDDQPAATPSPAASRRRAASSDSGIAPASAWGRTGPAWRRPLAGQTRRQHGARAVPPATDEVVRHPGAVAGKVGDASGTATSSPSRSRHSS